jgi:valyl-tRNA synthetase
MILGVTGIAVHPDDVRYQVSILPIPSLPFVTWACDQHLHGKFATHPFVQRRIPIITDDSIVDMELGTGAVDIAPAHDPNNYEVGLRHKLQIVNILNDDGSLNGNAGEKFKVQSKCELKTDIPLRADSLVIDRAWNGFMRGWQL